MTKPKNSDFDNSKTQIVTNLSSDSCDSSDNSDSSYSCASRDKKNCHLFFVLKIVTKSKTQTVTKFKNSIYDKTLKTQIVMKFKNTTCDKTQKLKI